METSESDALSKIAGNVVSSEEPGRALKAWRERLDIKQVSLAKAMRISPSVLSDYESGRRPSPGVQFVRRYVQALVGLDGAKGRLLSKLVVRERDEAILGIGEFSSPVRAPAILRAVEGTVLTGDESATKLYGFTVVDSIRTIYALSGYDFYRIFGATTERVIVFTKVGTGRSPLVAIRASPLKPRMVVVHGPQEIDPLAVELAKREGLLFALSHSRDEAGIIAALQKLTP